MQAAALLASPCTALRRAPRLATPDVRGAARNMPVAGSTRLDQQAEQLLLSLFDMHTLLKLCVYIGLNPVFHTTTESAPTVWCSQTSYVRNCCLFHV
jgi:hypothetical protein